MSLVSKVMMSKAIIFFNFDPSGTGCQLAQYYFILPIITVSYPKFPGSTKITDKVAIIFGKTYCFLLPC